MTSEKSTDKTIGRIAGANGFSLVESAKIEEIDGAAHVMKHDLSGARLLYLQNNDPNKSFSITFKTPAADDTGVFHILEHSVLCGSEKFPVKEPFVNLLKSSMQTFLNAMTFPDKTMYPVASTNEKDLMNLMDVYLDAVFHPNIYKARTIFEQEGWHLEFEATDPQLAGSQTTEPDETTAYDACTDQAGTPDISDAKLIYNGVVFNEMKGALSDPDSVLFDTLSAALFPDTTYRFESGGTPEAIPTLTYEAFLDNHRRHYRPDNSYIILYGDLDLDRFLSFINDQYLYPIAADPAYRLRPDAVEQGEDPIEMHPNPLEIQQPVRSRGIKKKMVTTPDNSCAALGFVIGRASEREKFMAVDILMDAIMGSNASPLKKALIDAQIANDCSAQVIDALAQPFVMLTAKGLKTDAVEKFEKVVKDEAERLSQGGLDRGLVRAALSNARFVMREQNFGYPDGVVLSMWAMSGWLYDDDMPYAYIPYEAIFESLEKKVDTGYFESLLKEILLDNDHAAQVEVVPVDEDSDAVLEKRLSAIRDSLDSDQLQNIASDLEKLREAQARPDSAEDLAKLPKLKISDIGEPPFEPDFHIAKVGGVSLLAHDVPTHAISYFYRYYSLSNVAFDDLPYVSILSSVLGKLETQEHSAIELDTLIQEKLGNLSFLTQIYIPVSMDEVTSLRPQFIVGTSALKENSVHAAEIVREIVETTKLDDPDRIYDILMQQRIMMEQKFAVSGNSFAVSRASSYFSYAYVIREQIDGIDFYRFLKELTDDFDNRSTQLIEKLKAVSSALFSSPAMLSFAGDDASIEAYLASWSQGLISPDEALAQKCNMDVPAPVDKREAFIAPCDVTFTASTFDRSKVTRELTGPWLVASRALTYDYLWNEVRVIGGAYGVGFTTTRQGQSYFHSYRDPHIDRTIARFDDAAGWLKTFDPGQDEFDGFIVSTASTFDAPLKPRALIRRQDGMFFADYPTSDRLELRQQVIDTKLADVCALSVDLDTLCREKSLCCVGNKEIIKTSNAAFEVIDLFA